MAKDEKPAKSASKVKPAKSGKDPIAGFDINNPELPEAIAEAALASGGFPYDAKIKRKVYEDHLPPLQLELLKFQAHIEKTGERVVILFEGRDTSGKGGAISTILERINPRHARAVALTKPTEAERGQWYFQRYIQHLPTAGDMTLFDRSWYNRAGVEHVTGFCTDEEYQEFLRSCPEFERMLIRSGIILVKYWFSVSDDEQERRFQGRIRHPDKRWKLSPMDLESRRRWVDYSRAKDDMFQFTDTKWSPWWVVDAEDKKRARLNCISHLLTQVPYQDITSAPMQLPQRQADTYVRPPHLDQTFIPEIW